MNTHTTAPPHARSANDYGAWLEMILAVAKHYRIEVSAQNVRLAGTWQQDSETESVLRAMARQAGLSIKFGALTHSALTFWRLPLVVQLDDGQLGLIESLNADDQLGVRLSGEQGLPSLIDKTLLLGRCQRMVILRPINNRPDTRVDEYVKPYEPNWFKQIILRDLRPYKHIMLASFVANVLGLSGVIFSMQVYDRVMPAQSYTTLYVLFVGVLIALIFDYIMRRMRAQVTDLLGKRADIRVSDKVFGQAIRLRNSARPRSTGTFISQLREIEQVREMVTSSTLMAVADLPFFFLFLGVFWILAGPLVLIPLAALVCMVLPGLLAQRKLARLAQETARESSLRNAMLVETIQGIEDVKAMQAEQHFQQQWNHFNAATADANLQLKELTSRLTTWSQSVQTGVFAFVVVCGAPMVIAGDLTTGSLIAASILGSRMMAPMAQINVVLTRFQQAKVAYQGLDKIMQMPTDNPSGVKKIHRPALQGAYVLSDAVFKYHEDDSLPALQVNHLRINPGERIAVLGKNGAGKSTLLQALTGGIDLYSGQILLDGVSLPHLDPADVRRDVGLLSQNSRLFYGTLHENLTLGAPQASDQDILAALQMTGALEFIQRLPSGLDHIIQEGGLGLSGGQRQSLMLARLALREPHVLLLDEPTASLDETVERQLLTRFGQWSKGKTVVIATHRMSILQLVDRIIVVDNGKIVLDQPKAKAIATLSAAAPAPAAEANAKEGQHHE